MAKTPPPSFMDSVNRWSFQTKLGGRPLPEPALFAQRQYRMALRRAQRFVLDDATVQLTCRLSHETDRLEGWSFLARLPYEPMWIEFNLHQKVRELHAMGALKGVPNLDRVSPIMGLLLYHDGDTRSRWLCHMFQQVDEAESGVIGGKVVIDPLAFVFDPEGEPLNPTRGSVLWRKPTLSLRPGFPRMRVTVSAATTATTIKPPIHTIGERYIKAEAKKIGDNLYEMMQDADPEVALLGLWHWDAKSGGIAAPDWLLSRTAVIVDPWHDGLHASVGERGRQRLTNLAAEEVQELRGQFRWVITLLAAINGLPKDTKPVVSSGHQTIGMNVLPYLQHNTLNIDLPREDRIRRARVILTRSGRNARRPWHRVIGHWRIIERGKAPPNYYCRHMPTMIEGTLGMCEKCEMLIRWIPQHERGDPSIGMVDHTYRVRGKRQTAAVELGRAIGEAKEEARSNGLTDEEVDRIAEE